MKSIILVSVLLVLFALLFPIVSLNPQATDTPVDDEPSPFYQSASDETLSIRLLDGGEVTELSMASYLFGALAAEMPASFELEALKAQAVALRSYVLYKMLVAPSANHPEADICSDSSCCAAWKTEAYLQEKWGENYGEYSAKLQEAVFLTDGLALAYNGTPALAVFHSSSPGCTESSQEVWARDLPYLTSVESPESAEQVPHYISSVTLSAQEFMDTVLEYYPDAVFSADMSDWIGEIEYSESGRIHSVELGGVRISGTQLRAIFSLRSAAIEFTLDGASVTMTCTGFGHGVGMSQYGANVYARQGVEFQDILAAFYPGTELVDVKELLAS